MLYARALAVWFVIILAETIHGIIRTLFIAPSIGDFRSRQIGVLIGSLLIFVVALLFSRWLDARTIKQQLLVGLVWVALTLAFEIGLGLATGASAARIAEDYDIANGGFMSLGLLFMLFTPLLAARIRRHHSQGLSPM